MESEAEAVAAGQPASSRQRAAGGPAPFLTKTHQMVEEASTDEVISWAEQGRSFVVWKPVELARDLLPLHFKHCNFSSFVRQLNTYVSRLDLALSSCPCVSVCHDVFGLVLVVAWTGG